MPAARKCRDIPCYGRIWLGPGDVLSGSLGPSHGRQPHWTPCGVWWGLDGRRRPAVLPREETRMGAEPPPAFGSCRSPATTLPPPAPPPSSSTLPPFLVSSPPPTSSPSPFPPPLPSNHRLPTSPSPCPCSLATLYPEPAEEIPTSNPSTKVGGREGGRDRRRAVRIMWEKLV